MEHCHIVAVSGLQCFDKAHYDNSAPFADRIQLERLRYWQGQALLSRDLNDQLTFEAQQRWWHNRALHNAYGVVTGLEVDALLDENGNQVFDDGVPIFQVSPGLAYDCFGRELCLQRPKEVRAPEPEPHERKGWTLLVSYRPTSELSRGACPPCDCGPAIEEPDLAWKPTRKVEVTDGVPLATGNYDSAEGGQFALGADLRKPAARPLARPIVGNGTTIQGETAWRPWVLGGSSFTPALHTAFHGFGPLGIEVTVDTSAAGFTETPCYFASLQGGLWSRAGRGFVPFVLERITVAAPESFTYSLWVPTFSQRQTFGSLNSFFSFARRQLYLCWVGVQTQHDSIGTSEVSHGTS